MERPPQQGRTRRPQRSTPRLTHQQERERAHRVADIGTVLGVLMAIGLQDNRTAIALAGALAARLLIQLALNPDRARRQ